MGFWSGKRTLVTGANGFVGSWICQSLLSKGANVAALSSGRKPLHYLKLHDLEDKVRVIHATLENPDSMHALMQQNEFESVFHLGAQSIPANSAEDPIPTLKSNVEGTWNLLEAARRSESVESIVISSAIRAYDPAYNQVTEETPLRGINAYDASKACADILARNYHGAYGLPTAVTRCTIIYGEADLNWSRTFPFILSAAILEKKVRLRGDGSVQRDYLYVQDAVNAHLLLGEKMKKSGVRGQAFNFSSGKTIAIQPLARRLVKACGTKAPIEFDGKQKVLEPSLRSVDSGKAMETLSWKPTHALEDGIRQTVPWYQQYLRGGVRH